LLDGGLADGGLVDGGSSDGEGGLIGGFDGEGASAEGGEGDDGGSGDGLADGVGGIAADLAKTAQMRQKLKQMRIQTQINREKAAAAEAERRANHNQARAEKEKVRIEKEKAKAAVAAAKGQLKATSIDTKTSKETAKQTDDVVKSMSDLRAAGLQTKAQKKNVKVATALAKQTDDVIKAQSDKEASFHQLQAQRNNALTAKELGKQTDDYIKSVSDRESNLNNKVAARLDLATQKTNAKTAKAVAKQSPDVIKSMSDREANKQSRIAARHDLATQKTNARTTQFKALQDPKVQAAITDLEKTRLDTEISKEKAKQNPALDQARKERALKKVQAGNMRIDDYYLDPKQHEIKKELGQTKLQTKLAKAQQELKDYEQSNQLDIERELDLLDAAEADTPAKTESLHEDAPISRLLRAKRSKEQLKVEIENSKYTPVFHEKGFTTTNGWNYKPLSTKTFFVQFDGTGYVVYATTSQSEDYADTSKRQLENYFRDFDELWDYIMQMVTKNEYYPEYNYITETPYVNESLELLEHTLATHIFSTRMTKEQLRRTLRENGVVPIYHYNPFAHAGEYRNYYLSLTTFDKYELISADDKGSMVIEETFDSFDDFLVFYEGVSESDRLYTLDIIITDI
jgi:hypothetical protein